MRGVTALLSRRRRRPAQDGPSAADMVNSVPEREFPYGRQPACGPDTNAFRRLGATFTPRPAAPTGPIAVGAQGGPGPAGVLAQVLDGLRNLDGKALDAARDREGLTYAHTAGAPLHNAVLAAARKPDGTPGLAPAAARRVASLSYPPCDGSATFRDYASLMRRVSELTGTQGTEWWPLPALPSGGPL